MNNPYLAHVSEYQRLTQEGIRLPLGGFSPLPLPPVSNRAPRVLLFSPHPDDECITGALPFRLRRELQSEVINVAVTQGSKKERQAGRLRELQEACHFLGFGILQTAPNGLDNIHPLSRQTDPTHWNAAVKIIAQLLAGQHPDLIFMPHANDWNSTHMATHGLVWDALKTLPSDFSVLVVETEFWSAMTDPNLMVESSVEDVASLVAATSFHVEEVRRNPYHLILPAWMRDNVRRGSELVGGQGAAAPGFTFATLYRLRKYGAGEFHRTYKGGKLISVHDDLSVLLANR